MHTCINKPGGMAVGGTASKNASDISSNTDTIILDGIARHHEKAFRRKMLPQTLPFMRRYLRLLYAEARRRGLKLPVNSNPTTLWRNL